MSDAMRTFVIFVAVLLAVGCSDDRNFMGLWRPLPENHVRAMLNCLRKKLDVGVPELKVPSFNPLKIDKQDVDFKSLGIPGVRGRLNVTDLTLSGATKWVVTGVNSKFNVIPPSHTLQFTLNFPKLSFDTGYNTNAEAFGNNIFGLGNISFEATNFSVRINTKIHLFGGISLNYFHVVPTLERMESFKVTGLFDDDNLSEAVSADVTAKAPSILKKFASDIKRIVNDFVVSAFNSGSHIAEFITKLFQKC